MNGGPTRTHALPSDSPAVGLGLNPLSLVNDQRGDTYARVSGSAIDIGAFELQTISPVNLPGDYNGNQSVDAADYVIWRKTKGADVPQYAGADGNGNSTIDDADYDVWRGNFGAPSSAAAAAAALQLSSTSDPEHPVAQSIHSQNTALFEAFAEFAQLRSEKSDSHNDDLPPGEQVSLPINQHDRDLALLAITGIRFGRTVTTVEKISFCYNCEPDAAPLDGTEILPPLSRFQSTLI